MKLALATLSLALLVLGTLWPWLSPQRDARSQAVTVRFTAFAWLLTVLLAVGAIFLPHKGRILLLLGAIFLATILARAWQRSQARARIAAQERANFQRARPLN